MNCSWKDYEPPDVNGNRRVRCVVCGYVTRTSMAWPFSKIYRECNGESPKELIAPVHALSTYGPGTELKSILSELGIKPTASCGCEAMIAKMNQWGADGCEAHREEILAHLQSAYNSADLATKLRAGANALMQGIPMTTSGLLDLAITRASKPTAW